VWAGPQNETDVHDVYTSEIIVEVCPGWQRKIRILAATGLVDTVLKQAHRRHLANLALEQAGLAISVGAAGAILLLLVGTQLLNWYWPLLLAIAGLAFGIYRSRRHRRTNYSLAQVVDSRLNLQDRLSTVYYFRRIADPAPELLETVEEQAQTLLHPGDAERAMPIVIPRAAYSAAALVVMCCGMLGLRYGLLRSLDLSRPLAHIEFNPFHEPPNVQASTKKSVIQERLEQQLQELGLPLDDMPASDREALQPQQETVSAVPSPEGEPSQGEKGQSTGEKSPAAEGEESEPGTDKGDSSEGKPDGKEGGEGNPGDEAKSQTPPNANKNPSKSGDQNSGLMDKMKDALANLLNKLKTPSRDQQSQQASNQSMQQQSAQQSPGQKGSQSPSRSQADGQPSPDQQGDREGDGDKLPGNQNRAGDKSADRSGGDESKTGMGQQDGSKEIKEAEQLAAMGKISEIFGKRAQQISGEMTIEVPSGKQQLKTAYSDRQAAHSGEGGEINRDEIPLAYQPYIQRYFEEVRKTPAKVKPPAGQHPPPTLSR
jgi:hypothetical protein